MLLRSLITSWTQRKFLGSTIINKHDDRWFMIRYENKIKYKICDINKQEAYGPHRSSEKHFKSLNTSVQSFDNTKMMIKKDELYFSPLYVRMLCAKFGWNWPSGSGEDF